MEVDVTLIFAYSVVSCILLGLMESARLENVGTNSRAGKNDRNGRKAVVLLEIFFL